MITTIFYDHVQGLAQTKGKQEEMMRAAHDPELEMNQIYLLLHPPPPHNHQHLRQPMIPYIYNSQQQTPNAFTSLFCHPPPPLSSSSQPMNIDLNY